MKSITQNLINHIDNMILQLFAQFYRKENSVTSLLFHNIFQKQNDILQNNADPQQKICIEHFRYIIEYFLDKNYTFITPKDLCEGMSNGKKNIIITFDDGYFNNSYILHILNEYKIPAVIYISVNHILHGKCFWWDVIYREYTKRGYSLKSIRQVQQKLKSLKTNEIETRLLQNYGKKCLIPLSDLDRPFSKDELCLISRQKYIHIGNHTMDHAILPLYKAKELEKQIKNAQVTINKFVGYYPFSISYPNGTFSKEVTEIAIRAGLKLGFSAKPQKYYIDNFLYRANPMSLGRFTFLGDQDIYQQCEFIHNYTNNYARFKNIIKHLISKNE
jgi:peptidoglycan/xylan/chitin deacetylase (PgdA/CDA1 family)